MQKTEANTKDLNAERSSIRRRVKRFYESFNRTDWGSCYSTVAPTLRENSRIDLDDYQSSLEAFKDSYGRIDLWYVRINPHLETTANQRDQRPFAYVYVVWQDEQKQFHMFRERWIKDNGSWYTRVVGLVANKSPQQANSLYAQRGEIADRDSE